MIASHLIFGAYGFWLPNDPRSSWSEFVGSWELFRYGPATKTTETRSVAHAEHDRAARLAAKEALKYPAVHFTDEQIQSIARGFGNYVGRSGLQVFACAIMPDHVHLVLGDFRIKPERIAIQLKGDATEALMGDGIHPFGTIVGENHRPPKCFARGEWTVFLDTVEDVLRAIRYVEENPIKEGRPRQVWPFVVPFIRDC